MMDTLISSFHQTLREKAVTESGFFLEKAADFLDAKHGSGFSNQHPELTIQLSNLYALDAIASALIDQSLGRD